MSFADNDHFVNKQYFKGGIAIGSESDGGGLTSPAEQASFTVEDDLNGGVINSSLSAASVFKLRTENAVNYAGFNIGGIGAALGFDFSIFNNEGGEIFHVVVSETGVDDWITLGNGTHGQPDVAGLSISTGRDLIQLNVHGHSTQTSKIVLIEDSAGVDLFAIDGTGILGCAVDKVQLNVKGHSTQTNPLFLLENSAGTDLFAVSNTGLIGVGVDRVQLSVIGHSTQTAKLMLLEKSDGTDVFAFTSEGVMGVANDRIQVRIVGHSTQTSALMLLEQSDGTDVLAIANDGALTLKELSGDPAGNPAAGYRFVYAKATGTYQKNSAGTVTALGTDA